MTLVHDWTQAHRTQALLTRVRVFYCDEGIWLIADGATEGVTHRWADVLEESLVLWGTSDHPTDIVDANQTKVAIATALRHAAARLEATVVEIVTYRDDAS
jgi:hypothetical protein